MKILFALSLVNAANVSIDQVKDHFRKISSFSNIFDKNVVLTLDQYLFIDNSFMAMGMALNAAVPFGSMTKAPLVGCLNPIHFSKIGGICDKIATEINESNINEMKQLADALSLADLTQVKGIVDNGVPSQTGNVGENLEKIFLVQKAIFGYQCFKDRELSKARGLLSVAFVRIMDDEKRSLIRNACGHVSSGHHEVWERSINQIVMDLVYDNLTQIQMMLSSCELMGKLHETMKVLHAALDPHGRNHHKNEVYRMVTADPIMAEYSPMILFPLFLEVFKSNLTDARMALSDSQRRSIQHFALETFAADIGVLKSLKLQSMRKKTFCVGLVVILEDYAAIKKKDLGL